MDENRILREAEHFVKELHQGDATGHDWWHIQRVRNLALRIANAEGANTFFVELSALLHDVDDWKMEGAKTKNQRVRRWLEQVGVDSSGVERICAIIEGVSFKGAGVDTTTNDLECQVVQDADRLDALGAIGIARTFAYGGSRGRELYDPEIEPEIHQSFEHYKKSIGPTINHFYEKLLLLKELMQTKTGKEMAAERHRFMELFLEQFYLEWHGNRP